MKFFILISFLVLIVGLVSFTPYADGYKVGDYATDFSLKNVDGTTVSLSDYVDAQGFIVVFTCNECPYAKLYQDRINDLNHEYESKGFPVIAINPNDPQRSPADSFEKMQVRAQEKDYSFPYLVDETQQITRTYGATNTPHVYVLEKEGEDKYRVAYIGTIDNNYKDADKADKHYVQDAVNALLQDQKVSTTKTKAIGCTIKWRNA
ncbi:MAG: thioredoxin family protein [Cyclobacteriaceae bacterium]